MKLISPLLISAVLLFSAPTEALANRAYVEAPVAQCLLAGLQKLEDSKKESAPEIKLPKRVQLPAITRDDSLFDFNMGVQWFRSQWNRDTIDRIRSIAKEAKSGSISAEDAVPLEAELKEIRSKLKFLRFLYVSLSKSHRTPPAFDEAATALGKLREALEHRSPEEWKKPAQRVLSALKPKELVKIEVEISAFEPTKQKSFNRWVDETLTRTQQILSQGKGTAEEWHQARKNLQALLSVYEAELQRSPSDVQLSQTVQYLLTQTELMGDEVSDHELAVLNRGLDYKNSIVPYPGNLVRSLREFLSRVQRSKI